MGMAASQARYLALVARKSNCEYEGQQINQARTVLANQSANLFNQMLGLNVPVPPSTQDFTKIQYSYSDGTNASTIDSWNQLANDPEYNYLVKTHYYTDRYTGSVKKMNDPQVTMSGSIYAQPVASLEEISAAKIAMEQAYAAAEAARALLEDKQANLRAAQAQLDLLKSQAEVTVSENILTNVQGEGEPYPAEGAATYTLKNQSGGADEYILTKLGGADLADVKDKLAKLGITVGDDENLYSYTDASAEVHIAREADIRRLTKVTAEGTENVLKGYNYNALVTATTGDDSLAKQIEAAENVVESAQAAVTAASNAYYNEETGTGAKVDYENAKKAYDTLVKPSYVGNSELTLLTTLTDEQATELRQVVEDMIANDVNTDIINCFDAEGNYLGGVYTFDLNGVTYYTTYNNLIDAYASNQLSNNDIDGQYKMPYYNASYVSTRVDQELKALMETDGNGRFTSVRFENDSITYALNMETITDDAAYQDAMNQYYYENAKYDKAVQDINAKTSLIQQEDRQLELRLKQLDTEQNALKTEMDAVQKVVKDNVENSFKTFGG